MVVTFDFPALNGLGDQADEAELRELARMRLVVDFLLLGMTAEIEHAGRRCG